MRGKRGEETFIIHELFPTVHVNYEANSFEY